MLKKIASYLRSVFSWCVSFYRRQLAVNVTAMWLSLKRDESVTWLRAHENTGGQWQHRLMSVGALTVDGAFTILLVGFIAFVFVLKFTPMFESEASSANISNETTSTVVDIAVWVLPVLGIVWIIRAFMKRGKTGQG